MVDRLTSLLSFRGRSTRLAYWRVFILWYLGWAAILALTLAGAHLHAVVGGVVFVLLVLPLAVAVLATTVRRLHDRDRAAWWLIPFLIAPVVLSEAADAIAAEALLPALLMALAGAGLGIWSFIDLGCLRGVRGANRFGDQPGGPAGRR
jgi:uncharacterized membrane protein YhaH (DUF805 family)